MSVRTTDRPAGEVADDLRAAAGEVAEGHLELLIEAAELLEAEPADDGAPLRFEARFNGGRGGATVTLCGRSRFVEGRLALSLANALDPGRASRGFEAEHLRKVERVQARLRRMAEQIRADGDPSHLAEQAEGIAAELGGGPAAELVARAARAGAT